MYLDENITVTWTIPTTIVGNKRYRISINNTVVFNGYVYYTGQPILTVDITDICRSLANDSTWIKLSGSGVVNNVSTSVQAAVYINNTWITTQRSVTFAYRYPKLISSLNNTFNNTGIYSVLQGNNSGNLTLVPRFPYISTNNSGFRALLHCTGATTDIQFGGALIGDNSYSTTANQFNRVVQSLTNFYQGAMYYPDGSSLLNAITVNSGVHGNAAWVTPIEGKFQTVVPNQFTVWIEDAQHNRLAFQTLALNPLVSNYEVILPCDHHAVTLCLGDDTGGDYLISDISNCPFILTDGRQFKFSFKSAGYDPNSAQMKYIDIVAVNEYSDAVAKAGGRVIANIDFCPAKYYLQWVDRFGGVQSQPVYGKPTFKQSYTRTVLESYQGVRRDGVVTSVPSFVVNTGWIDENLFPYWESVFVSPYLYLYDVENDTTYPVICTTNSYQEKTHHKEKTLLNIEFTFEQDKKQVILH